MGYKQCADEACEKYASISETKCGNVNCGGKLSAETTLSLEKALKDEALVKLDLIVPLSGGRHIELTNFLVMPGVAQFGENAKFMDLIASLSYDVKKYANKGNSLKVCKRKLAILTKKTLDEEGQQEKERLLNIINTTGEYGSFCADMETYLLLNPETKPKEERDAYRRDQKTQLDYMRRHPEINAVIERHMKNAID